MLLPLTIEGERVRLEPLGPQHVEALAEVGLAPELWTWTVSRVRSAEEMRAYVEAALARQRAGTDLPFAIVLRDGGRVVGSSRLANADLFSGRVEIGWSWVAPAWQRSFVNSEAKLLLLRHAFETLGCVRVELKTDALNERSRAAILRLGATEEGTLRRHTRTESGRIRDTVYFSILDDEWPRVRERLEARLRAG